MAFRIGPTQRNAQVKVSPGGWCCLWREFCEPSLALYPCWFIKAKPHSLKKVIVFSACDQTKGQRCSGLCPSSQGSRWQTGLGSLVGLILQLSSTRLDCDKGKNNKSLPETRLLMNCPGGFVCLFCCPVVCLPRALPSQPRQAGVQGASVPIHLLRVPHQACCLGPRL